MANCLPTFDCEQPEMKYNVSMAHQLIHVLLQSSQLLSQKQAYQKKIPHTYRSELNPTESEENEKFGLPSCKS